MIAVPRSERLGSDILTAVDTPEAGVVRAVSS
jgi:hypothetical protein